MDGSSSLPLPLPRPSPTPPPPPAPQVFLRRPVPPPHHPPRAPAPPATAQVHFFRAPSPIPIYNPRLPGPRAAAARPPMPPPPAPAAPAAAVAPPRPPPPALASSAQPPPRPPPPAPASSAQPPPRLPPPSPAAAAAPPPTLKAVGRGRPKTKAPDNEQKNERENVQSQVSKGETGQGHHKDTTTGLVNGIKRPRKQKGSKHTLHMPDSHGATEGDAGPSLFSSNNCRYDSSLGLLTKKFINLLERAEDGTLDLNKAAETLEVQKRRIYDITNVLEGVDLIEKKLKNMISWKGFDMSKPKEMERQTSVLKEEIESLYHEDSRLDDKIMEAQEKLQALMLDEDKRKWLYLSKEDINKIPRFQGSTLIAINAPHGTYVEVPDPIADLDFFKDLDLQERHYHILLRSSMGPIDCYLISDHQEICNPDQMAPDNLDPLVATGSSQALQQVGYDPSQAQEKGESNAVGKPTSEPSRTHEFMAGILRIVPSDADIDADYWLASDVDVSMTDTWAT